MVEIDIGPEPLGIAADYGEHQRQIVAHGADDGFGAAADADPGLERSDLDRRVDALIGERRSRPPLPGHRLLSQQGGEQIELVFEQFLVSRKLEPE